MSTIQVRQAAVVISSAYDFGNGIVTVAGSPVVFTIVNTGSAAVQVGGSSAVQITGANAADFHLTSAPATMLASGQSTTFSVAFDPGALGPKTATVTIAPQGGADSVSFSAAGTGVDFGVEQPDGKSVNTYTFPTRYGSAAGSTVTFTIANTGSNPIGPVSVLAGAGFTLGAYSPTTIGAGDTVTFDLTFTPAGYGTTTSSVTVSASGVPDYVVTVSGTWTSGSLLLKDSNGDPIADGGTVDLGTVYQGGTTSSFTITNNSASDVLQLTGGTPKIDPPSSDFSLTPTFLGTSINYGAPGTVTINAGSPSTSGTYSATVLVQTSDANSLSVTFQIRMNFINSMHP